MKNVSMDKFFMYFLEAQRNIKKNQKKGKEVPKKSTFVLVLLRSLQFRL
jgi:hypothetical protein